MNRYFVNQYSNGISEIFIYYTLYCILYYTVKLQSYKHVGKGIQYENKFQDQLFLWVIKYRESFSQNV